jgi:hypothetical protein
MRLSLASILAHRPSPVMVAGLSLVFAVSLSGCTALPKGKNAGVATEPAPMLLPLDQILAAAAEQPGGASAARAETLAARAARLRARAALMRGPVMEPETRARLEAAILAGQA